MGIKYNSNTVKPNGISKVYYGSNLVYEARSVDAVLVGGSSNALAGYIQTNSITSLQIVDKANVPSTATDVTSSITNLSDGYAGVSGTTLYVTGKKAGNIVYAGSTLNDLLTSCATLTSINLSNFNTSNCTNMDSMFNGCSGLTSLDVSGFDTSNVTNMWGMFLACSSLTTLTGLTNFNTGNVTNLSTMFRDCRVITSLDVSSFNTSKVTTMQAMFQNCYALTTITGLTNFDTSLVTGMGQMFYDCRALTSVDLSGWTVTKLTTTQTMFFNDALLTSVDVSGWKPTALKTLTQMFYGCVLLTYIYSDASWYQNYLPTYPTPTGTNMFYNCYKLPNFSAGSVTHIKARLSTEAQNAGYFTFKS